MHQDKMLKNRHVNICMFHYFIVPMYISYKFVVAYGNFYDEFRDNLRKKLKRISIYSRFSGNSYLMRVICIPTDLGKTHKLRRRYQVSFVNLTSQTAQHLRTQSALTFSDLKKDHSFL